MAAQTVLCWGQTLRAWGRSSFPLDSSRILDDEDALAHRHERGTTSLAWSRVIVVTLNPSRSLWAVTGPHRSVLLAVVLNIQLSTVFFRKLPGDDRINAALAILAYETSLLQKDES